jgi:signal transduction histidine kinase
VDPAAGWSTQQLAEFLALVSSFESEASAALGAVERVAQALDAEVAAIVSQRKLIAAVGYAEGAAQVEELAAVASGASRDLAVPGRGICSATVVPLDYPPGAALVLARSGAHGLGREETSVLHGMARVASLTMRMLHLLGEERAAREESQRQAMRSARLLAALTALHRVATLVARGVDQEKILAAVAEEVGRLASTDMVQIYRFESGNVAVRLAAWSASQNFPEIGEEVPVGAHNIMTMVQRTGRPARIDDTAQITAGPAYLPQSLAVRSAVGNPIVVDGRVWGAVVATTTRSEPMPEQVARRISGFTELVATAISNAHARTELAASRARVVAASDETRRRIERDLHDGIQQRLVTLALGMRGAIDAAPMQASDLRAQLTHAERGIQYLLEEIREISRGLHPAILAEAGLVPALKSLARRSAVSVTLDVRFAGRLPMSIESAAYYLVSEALTNAVKHANATVARVMVEMHGGLLRIEVSDDGIGGADASRGSGLIGLNDRVEALGGTLAVSSPPDGGTTLVAELPTGLVSQAPA